MKTNTHSHYLFSVHDKAVEPASVSARVAGDTRMILAHDRAVEKALAFINNQDTRRHDAR
jgi:hypothetical protein